MLKVSIGVSAPTTHVFVLMRKLKQSLESIFLVKPTIQKLIELSQEFDLPIIEDAAQAHGTELMVNGTPMKVGTLGDIGCFSFFPTKNMAVGGEGGMITTNNVELGKRLHDCQPW